MSKNSTEIIAGKNLDPAYLEGLSHVLNDPIYVNSTSIGNQPGEPTPLDPKNVFVRRADKPSDWNDLELGTPYYDHAISSASESVALHADLTGADEMLTRYLVSETCMQIENRMKHNEEAFVRLSGVLTNRPTDENMLDIAYRARYGKASLPEMLRLIKEYPEMVSIETSSFYATAGGPEGYNPIREAYAAAGSLVKLFEDAEVRFGGDSAIPQTKESTLLEGSKVRKRVLATIVSVDSHTEMVLKETIVVLGGREFLLGVCTYFRTGDRQNRPGYDPEELKQPDGEEVYYKLEQGLGQLASGENIITYR